MVYNVMIVMSSYRPALVHIFQKRSDHYNKHSKYNNGFVIPIHVTNNKLFWMFASHLENVIESFVCLFIYLMSDDSGAFRNSTRS